MVLHSVHQNHPLLSKMWFIKLYSHRHQNKMKWYKFLLMNLHKKPLSANTLLEEVVILVSASELITNQSLHIIRSMVRMDLSLELGVGFLNMKQSMDQHQYEHAGKLQNNLTNLNQM